MHEWKEIKKIKFFKRKQLKEIFDKEIFPEIKSIMEKFIETHRCKEKDGWICVDEYVHYMVYRYFEDYLNEKYGNESMTEDEKYAHQECLSAQLQDQLKKAE